MTELPPDLLAVLRDQSIIVSQDQAVFELIASWMNAPCDTASALPTDPRSPEPLTIHLETTAADRVDVDLRSLDLPSNSGEEAKPK
jgi:hypothetical protein